MRLWGRKSSINVQKVLWCLAELSLLEGQDFERIDAGLQFGINRSPEFLELNPNGLVPTLEDEGLVLWESNTIMRYLARKYDSQERFPKDIASQYSSEKWLDWQVGTVWPSLRGPFLGLTRVPEKERNYQSILKGYQDSDALFGLLDQSLAKTDFCSGNRFHLGDMALALCVNRWILLNDAFPDKTGPRSSYKNIERWMKRIQQETDFLNIAEKQLNII